jgi:hypothetical protein
VRTQAFGPTAASAPVAHKEFPEFTPPNGVIPARLVVIVTVAVPPGATVVGDCGEVPPDVENPVGTVNCYRDGERR